MSYLLDIESVEKEIGKIMWEISQLKREKTYQYLTDESKKEIEEDIKIRRGNIFELQKILFSL
jgi:hypothetical protein